MAAYVTISREQGVASQETCVLFAVLQSFIISMPCSNKAKNWKPDAFGEEMINRTVKLILVAERCGAHLRSLNSPFLSQLWAEVQADFVGDTLKYPSIMAVQSDAEGRKQFRIKYEAICFPTNPPHRPEE
jgi:hypothetical protein